ncbi:hypothetical protein VZC42_08995 [Raoultella ornithinolytica]|uniref:hypothetical protein n=1 Tax=Raoultella ornithinolytica TaxID=54291 RepID=UPI0038A28EA4
MGISRRRALQLLFLNILGVVSKYSYPSILKNKKFDIVHSFSELKQRIPQIESEIVSLQSWHNGFTQGGGQFIAIKGYLEGDDGGLYAKVSDEWYWKRILLNNYYTPEMFGAIGDGKNDDFHSIQQMLNSVPELGIVRLDGGKVYFNAFAQDGDNANIWIRNKPITIYGNYALLTRRKPIRIGFNDNKTSVLKLTGDGPFQIHRLKIEGNNPVGTIKDHHKNDTTITGYAICECQDFGLHIENASNVNIIDADISLCSFNIWVDSSRDIKVTGKLYKSGQVVPNITAKDLAYGAGIKLINSQYFYINVIGNYNTNATVEIEPNNSYGNVSVFSINNLSNGLVIYNSNNINFYSHTKDTKCGNGTYIISNGGEISTENISGTSITEGCSWIGTYLELKGNSGFDVKNINITCVSSYCSNCGFAIDNNSKNKAFNNISIKYNGDSNGLKTHGYDMRVIGEVSGEIIAKIKRAKNGIFLDGNEMKNLKLKMNLSDVENIPYKFGKDVQAVLLDN